MIAAARASTAANWRAPAVAVGVGGLAGATLDLLTYWVAFAGPVGDGWSFRGNGALVVPFGLGPAIVAGGWTAVVLRHRGVTRWVALGVGTALIGSIPPAASVAALLIFGRAAQSASDLMTLPTLVWPLLALLLAAFAPLARPSRPTPGAWETAASLVLFAVAVVAGFALAAAIVPPGSR